MPSAAAATGDSRPSRALAVTGRSWNQISVWCCLHASVAESNTAAGHAVFGEVQASSDAATRACLVALSTASEIHATLTLDIIPTVTSSIAPPGCA